MGQIAAEGPGLGLAKGGEWWGEKIARPEQLQGRSAGEGRLLDHDAVDDQEVKYVWAHRGEEVSEVFVATGEHGSDQRVFGVRAVRGRDRLGDLRKCGREAHRRERCESPPDLLAFLGRLA